LNQITSSDHLVTQKTLQWLCDQLADGQRFVDPKNIRDGLRLCLISPSMGVRRWALNAVAIVGLGPDNTIILEQLQQAESDPDLMTAVVAALYSNTTQASELLSARGVDLSGVNLIAAAQYSREMQKLLISEKIPIDNSSADELKAGLILAGTRKAPEHLFFANHKNVVALEQLNLHPVPSVSKYSIWALAKLKLGFDSLKIPIASFESSPPEIRKWILRLLFSDEKNLSKNLDMVQRAGRDDSDEVRHESAIELRNSFVNDLGNYVKDWYFSEPHIPARDALIEHMAAQAYRSDEYLELVSVMYEREPFGSQLRTRLEAAAAGTSCYQQLRRISAKQEIPTLFAGHQILGGNGVTNINNNFGTGNSFGALAIGGGAISADTISAVNSVQNSTAKEVLESVMSFINGVGLNAQQKAEAEGLLREAAKSPSKTTFQKLAGYLTSLGTAASAADSLVGGIDGLVEKIQAIPF
jgi:hypothetical protein